MEVFRGEGLNESPNPIEKIFPFASGLALFAVTLGDKVRGKIDALFTTDDFALGCLLDTAASLAADRAAAWLEARCSAPSQRLRARPKGGALSGGRAPQEIRPLRYSPGYCGWHLSGQKKLFARLKPERIGLRLNESWLMSPLKSVSGVIVTAPASRHAVEPSYGFCASCRNRTCKTRSGTRPEGLGKEAA
ncbi:MAG: hypothetical protein HY748_12115 [Elusimicrobia bacterium]|nr:hypothetical protein [Elusimicrobiota bacterium]